MRRIVLPRRVNRRVIHKRVYYGQLLNPGALCGAANGGKRSTEKWENVSCGKCLTRRGAA